ncbi:MAG: glycosyltransferase family 39 protein [Pirellulaceae bacterium]|nr:glycosyltransferase family 39 protein [Pirellulaceae bacterium]
MPHTPAAVGRAEPIAPREWLLLAAIVAAGVLLRGYAVAHSGVEHFDEGVYASNVYFGQPSFAYPQRNMYAPPLLPWLIEAGMLIGLSPNLAAVLPGFLAGCGTIVALWWFGRSWFGPAAGLSAAVLCAFSQYHIAYSAAALTDVLLGLWIVLAVDAMARSLANADFRWAIGAGLYTGLAWWTKYNGWLPLAMEGGAIPLLYLLVQPDRKRLLGWLGCFAVTVIVALIAWSPFYLSLAPGEYAAITANHAKAVVGFAGWLDSASRQIAAMGVMEGGGSVVGLGLAFGIDFLFTHETGRKAMRFAKGGLVLFLLLVAMLTPFVVAGLAGLAGLVIAIGKIYRAPKLTERLTRRAIAVALLAAWWGGLFVATPCYWPFPRLVLPWLVCSWLAWMANAPDAFDEEKNTVPSPSKRWEYAIGYGLLCVAFVIGNLNLSANDHRVATGDRRELARIASEIQASLAEDQPRAIYVFGEPAMFFQLRAAGEEIVEPIQTIATTAATMQGRPIPTYLVAGPHANRDPRFVAALAAAQVQWELVRAYPHRPSVLVWLDLYDPRLPPGSERGDLDEIRLYRLTAREDATEK